MTRQPQAGEDGTIRGALFALRAALDRAGCPDAEADARQLLARALDCPWSAVLARYGDPMPEGAETQLRAWVIRRCAGEPLQYILGDAWFMGLRFRVDERVLIPRFDTEVLAEAALEEIRANERVAKRAGKPGGGGQVLRALDIGTGSGALAVTLAKLGTGSGDVAVQVVALDISPDALRVARENARLNGVEDRIDFLRGDVWRDWVPDLRGAAGAPGGEPQDITAPFDLIVSNPPYIETGEMPALQREVRREPRLALDGGADGLDVYRRIAAGLPARLAPGGAVLLEVGLGQAEAVGALIGDTCQAVEFRDDLRGIPRVVLGRRRDA